MWGSFAMGMGNYIKCYTSMITNWNFDVRKTTLNGRSIWKWTTNTKLNHGFSFRKHQLFYYFPKSKKKPPIDLSFFNLKDKEQKRNHPFIYPSFSWIFFQPAQLFSWKKKRNHPLIYLSSAYSLPHLEPAQTQIILKHITDEPAQTQIIMKHLTD